MEDRWVRWSVSCLLRLLLGISTTTSITSSAINKLASSLQLPWNSKGSRAGQALGYGGVTVSDGPRQARRRRPQPCYPATSLTAT
jgi:hypothetical protein